MLPNFFILGAAKAGTTSLYYYLKQHPEIFMPEVKEINFFVYHGRDVRYRDPFQEYISPKPYQASFEGYEALFQTSGERAVGEASTLYLYEEAAAYQLKAHAPKAKLIIVLRDPIARAYSQYLHLLRDGKEPLETFADALAAEPMRQQEGYYPSYHYTAVGRYAEQLRRYFSLFDEGQIHILMHEDLRQHTAREVQKLYAFLEVDANFAPDTSLTLNASGLPKSRMLHDFITRPHAVKSLVTPLIPEQTRLRLATYLNKVNLSRAPKLDAASRRSLQRTFHSEREHLQQVLGKDLGHWKHS